jgi:hypothetical protein
MAEPEEQPGCMEAFLRACLGMTLLVAVIIVLI